ncbi:MarR family winged helix-turn-helix transcriptional regulator [Virgibacillus oceani]|uniref:HTH marR-type domain-containing protein n=1 Tax=Virgibacillus oceani TaxID=1479511 RepID=A0A917HIT1_9BACI|nr:MarR family transcriptional regulator [Virgibacillus oceani]GGG79884.1 hypothetical protein GCM10011398_26500 [Virgibacillus oceani]
MEEQTIFEIIHSMDKVTNKLIIQWNKLFKEDLGVSHILILGHLKANGKSRSSDIAKAIGLTPPSVTHLSEKLVHKELVTRIIGKSDRRITYLAITDKGDEVLKWANQEGQILRRNLFEKLTEEDRLRLLEIYRKLSDF